MNDTNALRRTLRTALLAGELPTCRPERTWGGRGSGGKCKVCASVIERDDMELELDFGRQAAEHAGVTYRVHVRCYSAWEEVRRSLARAEERPVRTTSAPDLFPDEDEGNFTRHEHVSESNGEPR